MCRELSLSKGRSYFLMASGFLSLIHTVFDDPILYME
jgi:hypothetical protein